MLKEGDVIRICEGHEIYATVPEHFVYANKRGVFKMTHTQVKVGGELDYLAGTYIVVKTALDGGTSNGEWPDGHHVFCQHAGNDRREIDFYQSGGFDAKIEDIKSIGKGKLTWVLTEKGG